MNGANSADRDSVTLEFMIPVVIFPLLLLTP